LIANRLAALMALDPGGIRLTRGVHLLLVTVASGLVGLVVDNRLDIPETPNFALFCGAVALNAFICTVPGTRRSETFGLLKNFGIAFGVFGLGVLVDWGDLGLGVWPVEFAWVAAIAFGLYLRRYGPAATQYGLMTMLMFMFVTLANPTREMALWLVLAVAVACVTTFVVFAVAWRPSAVATFRREAVRFQGAVATELDACRDKQSQLPAHWAQRAWEELVRAGQLALAEAPDERQRLQHVNALALRLLMALKVVTEATLQSAGGPPGEGERREIDRLFGDVLKLLTAAPDCAESMIAECQTALSTLRDDLLADRTLARRDKFHWLRQVIGLMRMIVSVDGLRRTTAGIGEPSTAPAPAPTPGPSASKAARNMGCRLALQGLVAAGTTVALAYIFDLDHAYWATMTVFIVLSASLGATIKRTIERAFGTTVGVLIALGVVFLLGDEFVLEIVLVSLATIPIFVLVERHYMITAGLIGFLVVLVLHMVEGVGIDGMTARLYQTAIGAGLALLAAWLVFPIHAVDNVKPLVRRLLDDCREALVSVRDGAAMPAVNIVQRQTDAQALANELVSLNSERLMSRRHGMESARLQAHADAVAGYLALYVLTLQNLRSAEISPSVRRLQRELTDRIAAELSSDLDSPILPGDAHDLIEKWQAAVPLDGSIPSRDALVVVEELYYGRKLIETLAGLKSAVASLHV
jgi:uncharacterized membrane protein YccC